MGWHLYVVNSLVELIRCLFAFAIQCNNIKLVDRVPMESCLTVLDYGIMVKDPYRKL